MRLDALKARRWAGGMLLGLSVLGGMLPETALALDVATFAGGTVPELTLAQYGTSRRVARRTSRRTSRRHAAAYGGYGAYGVGVATGVAVAAVPVGVSYIHTLPTGCAATTVGSVTYQQCGAVRYRPYYQGDTLVYVEE